MQDVIPDLWPDEIARTEVPTPLAILRIQANHLRTKTKGIIEAEVRSWTDKDKQREFYRFELVAPALDGYTVRLFTADHAMSLVYPITFRWDGFDEGPVDACDPDAVYSILQEIFANQRTKSILMSMMARSNEQRGATGT